MAPRESTIQTLLDQAWRKVSSSLREKLGEEVWRELVDPLVVQEIRRGEVVLRAPDRFLAERGAARVGFQLEQALSHWLGVPLRVRILGGAPPPADLSRPGRAGRSQAPELLEHGGNRMAIRALKAGMGPKGDPRFNPLYIWGREGVGKTFLVRSLLFGRDSDGGIYLKALDFLEDLAHARRKAGGLSSFRERILGTRLLVVDEVHRLKGKPAAQAELVHLLKVLLSRGGRVVFLGRYSPREIRRLDRSLLSILLSGFSVEVQVPGEAARLEALLALEREAGPPSLPPYLVQELARRHKCGYGPLREAWLRLRQSGIRPSDEDEAGELLERVTGGRDTLDRILRRVSAHFGLSPEDLLSERRSRNVSLARQVAAYVALERGFSLAAVAERLGGRSRSTVSYMRKRIAGARKLDPSLDRLLEDLA